MSKKDKEAPAKDKEGKVYHFTDKKGYEGIMKDKTINASVERKDDDVTYGAQKSYLNELDPKKNTPLQIAINNYDGSPDYAKSKLPSTEYAFQFDAKDIGAKPEPDERSIHTVDGDIDASKAEAIFKYKDGKYQKISKEEKKE